MFTIIIPVKEVNDYVRETVPYILRLKNAMWELLILPNEESINEWSDSRIHIIPSGKVGPGIKRDIGARHASGDILVFLDDDSYPSDDLLDVAKFHFTDPTVVALGGPAITPPHDSYWQRVSGAVFLSKFSGGAPERYVPVGAVRVIDDWPSVNLMVRKKDFIGVGGFNTPYWPGEDTKLCLDLIQKTGKRILYVPELCVWHHRRAGLMAHLKQIGGYGVHRGYFARKYPETSRKLLYFIPSIFVMFVVATLMRPLWNSWPLWPLAIGWVLYGMGLTLAWYDMRKYEKPNVAFVALGYTFLTHIFYGCRFIQGMLTPRLESRLR